MKRHPQDETVLTIEEFEQLPEENGYLLELVKGLVVREPRPAHEHGRIVVNIAALLHAFVKKTKLGVTFAESGFVLADAPATVRGPDVSFVTSARLAAAAPFRIWPRLAPDLAVEVVSPSNTAAALQEKVSEYLAAGSRLVWVVYPKTLTVVVYRSNGNAQLLGAGDILDGGEVLPGFSVLLSEFFD